MRRFPSHFATGYWRALNSASKRRFLAAGIGRESVTLNPSDIVASYDGNIWLLMGKD